MHLDLVNQFFTISGSFPNLTHETLGKVVDFCPIDSFHAIKMSVRLFRGHEDLHIIQPCASSLRQAAVLALRESSRRRCSSTGPMPQMLPSYRLPLVSWQSSHRLLQGLPVLQVTKH